jgi:hypothetical protein
MDGDGDVVSGIADHGARCRRYYRCDCDEVLRLFGALLAPRIAVRVHNALHLVIAFKTSKYLSLVCAIEVVRAASDERGRLAAMRAWRFIVHAIASRLL